MMPDIVLMVGEQEINRINFGVTPVDSESIIEVDIFNKGDNKLIDLRIKPLHPDITILSSPKELDKKEKQKITLRYKPETQLDKGVESEIVISGGYVV
jgi:hypothetical protein